MRFVTAAAISRRSVTLLAIILVLAAGAFTYRTLPVELFPEVEFPLVTVVTFYPSANPEAVVEDVTAPIEKAMSGVDGLDGIQSISTENRSVILANFEFGTDMAEAEAIIDSNVKGIRFPDDVNSPIVGRVDPESFPVLQISVTAEEDLFAAQRVVESRIVPAISAVEGVFTTEVTGTFRPQVTIEANPDLMMEKGVSLFQVSQALRENSITFPGGSINDGGLVLPIKTTNRYESIEDLERLVVGSSPLRPGPPAGAPTAPPTPVTLGEVAEVRIGTGASTSISRTNGKPSIGVAVIKEPDANTIDVTTTVLAALDEVGELPPGVELVIVSNDGPQIQKQIDTLEREAILGLALAVAVVFAFFVTLRPSAIRGMLTTLRPTVVIGLSIPLSILTGVLLMDWQGLSLNFMTLGGLAISVGRVVDDSIVVLENIYRNIEGGRERWRAALDATVEVGPAITASTLTTIVVFVPLGLIEGLVGAFFFPFALTVSFALIASLVVALTAVPVLGAYLLRPGDLPEGVGESDDLLDSNTWMQRVYTPILRWSLSHKLVTLAVALLITVASLGLLTFIPVNLFSSSDTRFLTVDMSLPPGTPPDATLAEVEALENELSGDSEVYVTVVGSQAEVFGQSGPTGFNESFTFARLSPDAPTDITDTLRDRLDGVEGRVININEISAGPPGGGLEVNVTGADYDDITSVTGELVAEFASIYGVENVTSDIAAARPEIVVNVDPAAAAAIGLSTQMVAFQVNQFLVGQTVAQVPVDGRSLDVVLTGRSDDIDSVDKVRALVVAGPLGVAPLEQVAAVEVGDGPVTISRTDGQRSSNITGTITVDDTQAVGQVIQEKIDGLSLPPGVEVTSGGVFAQIAEGFQDIFLAMAIGVCLVYLVMVASLGSLRNPFVIVTSLPLALIGVMASLAITGRSLGLPAMMGVLLLIGIVVTNAIVLISFVEQLRGRGLSVYDALMRGGRIRLRPILMTAITTSMALLPLAAFVEDEGGILGAELATVVIGGLVTSTALTLIVVPVVYTLANENIPNLFRRGVRSEE